ncbi:Proline-rich protein PRCC [Parasponia andersonii]|uniref:Proline-rich protein PRCC n=1 Tax=Parasponia andersonii TaxID=3476 RepID=A0A2P5C4P2_PARAD|nr:Proline-rich protein PRCC [Parasponia andersonii]
MESLLANYASSDEEKEDQPRPPPKRTALSLPKSSSSFPQNPEKEADDLDFLETASESGGSVPKASSIFSILPTTKRVVQFRPPVIPLPVNSREIDDDDEEKEKEREIKRRRGSESSSQTSSAKFFLSTLPAAKNSATLGALPSSGSGRRAVVETELSASNSGASAAEKGSVVDTSGGNDGNLNNSVSFQSGFDQNAGNNANYSYESYELGADQNAGNYSYYENYNPGFVQSGSVGETGLGTSSEDGSSYGSYGDYGQYGNNWVDESVAAVPENSGVSHSGFKVSGKIGRNDIPSEIIEVKQDELIKNRPREDQVKLTGIAFGPSYQPVSTKGKPSKLHKRKHQIGSLYFDMKQKEMELSERRAKGFLTKAETQAKYGW